MSGVFLNAEERFCARLESIAQRKLSAHDPDLVCDGAYEISHVLWSRKKKENPLSTKECEALFTHIMQALTPIVHQYHFNPSWDLALQAIKHLTCHADNALGQSLPTFGYHRDENRSLFVELYYPEHTGPLTIDPETFFEIHPPLFGRSDKQPANNTTIAVENFQDCTDPIVFFTEPIEVHIDSENHGTLLRTATNIPRTVCRYASQWLFTSHGRASEDEQRMVGDFIVNLLNHVCPPGSDELPTIKGADSHLAATMPNTSSFTASALVTAFFDDFLKKGSPQGQLLTVTEVKKWIGTKNDIVMKKYEAWRKKIEVADQYRTDSDAS